MNVSPSIFLGGFKIIDRISSIEDIESLTTDLAIIVIGWESRSSQLLEAGALSGDVCLLLNFKDDNISEAEKARFHLLASRNFSTVENVELCSPLEAETVMSETEDLVRRIYLRGPTTCSVDYSSMPRVVTQTLFRQFMVEGVCPKVNWCYSSGLYDTTPAASSTFVQGAKEFFSIRGAEGGGGMSNQKIAVLALGADRSLISSFLRDSNYDMTHFLDAESEHSPKLEERIKEQRKWLQIEYGVQENNFTECSASSVVGTLSKLLEIMSDYPTDGGSSVDLFCSGPKSHAISASALVNSFSNVRLVGRVPKEYLRIDVKPTKEVSITTVSDYTNPSIIRALLPKE